MSSVETTGQSCPPSNASLPNELTEAGLQAVLDLAIADDQAALLVARDQRQLLIDARIQLVEASEHV